MSLVGPRPDVPQVVATYPLQSAERHAVRPGVTGLWQVTARSVKPMEAGVGIDLEYVQRVSFRLDRMILLATPPAVVATAREPRKDYSAP